VCRGELDGALVCRSCGRHYETVDGIPRLLDPTAPGLDAKLRELAGWPELAKEQGWYEADDRIDAALPFLNRDLGWEDRAWAATEYGFQLLLDHYVKPGDRVLELGAAKSWASLHLLPRGCEYVACDLVVDPLIGLGRGRFFEERVGPYLRIQADGERLPFADSTFDVAFCVATLHHALDLQGMVDELARVTRRGGVVAGLNEGTKGVRQSSENPDQEAEKALGINEHVHTIWAYVYSFSRAGLVVRRLERADGWPPVPYGRALSTIPKVGPSLGALAHLTAAQYSGVSIYARKRV
jgi:SAM-dependent methyltransferase